MSTTPAAESSIPVHPLAAKLFRVAWLSIAIGSALELILLIATAAAGKDSSVRGFIADLVQKVSWSTLICMGIAVGTAAGKAMRHIAMGVLGFLAAPLAFTVARVLHKSVSHALGLDLKPGGAIYLALAIKALEYAIFGYLIGRLARLESAGARHYLTIGITVGAVFAALNLSLLFSQPVALPAAEWVGRGLNEFFFPIGCAFVLYVVEALGRKSSSI